MDSIFYSNLCTRLLLEQIIKQWRLEQTENSIRNELNFIANEVESMEQSLLSIKQEQLTVQQELLTTKQNHLNKLALAFTLITVVGVTAQIVILSPLKTMFPETTKELLWTSQLFIVMLAAAALIGGAVAYYSHAIRKMSQSSTMKKVSQTVQQRTRNIRKRRLKSIG